MLILWGTPVNVQWYRVVDYIRLGDADEAYLATITLVRMVRRLYK